jgi:hypothetical protein
MSEEKVVIQIPDVDNTSLYNLATLQFYPEDQDEGRWRIAIADGGGYDCIYVDLGDLLKRIKKVKPEVLEALLKEI